MILTAYNGTKGQFYKIAGIDFSLNPESTFIRKEKSEEKNISYIEYY